MRARLLEATVELLVEQGYAGTSTTLVSERAGVSRGAQLHHFPTKQDLVVAAVAAPDRGPRRRAGRGRARSCRPGRRRTRAVLQVLGDHFTSPVFTAALELWVAARTDPALLAEVAPLEQKVGRETHRMTVELLGADESQPGVRELVQATLDLVRGLGLADTISDDTRRRSRILDQWAADPRRPRWSSGMTDLLDRAARRPRPPRATSSARPSTGSAPTAGRAPTPGARLDRRHPGRAPALDRRGRRPRGALARGAGGQAGVGRRRARGDRRPDRATSTRAPSSVAALPRDEVLDRWTREPRRRCARRSTQLPAGPEDAVVRPADVGRLDGDRAVHGDLGARARRLRRRRASGPTPTDRIRHVAHLGVRTRDFAYSVHEEAPPAEEFRVELTAPERRAVDVGARGRRAVGHAVRRTTSACWSPSASTAPTPTWSPSARDAEHWLDIAQAFAGPPGPGREAAR